MIHDTKTLLNLFFSMLRIRRIEEAIEREYCKNEMKTPIHLMIGQEAVAVGACLAMRQKDYVYCGHRTHGIYLAKGGSLKSMLAELFCKATGCAGSRGGSMHLLDHTVGMMGSSAICAGIIPIATGAALTAQMDNDDRITTVFFGDGASEEGVTWESINFAAVKKLPILYFCENNLYSVQTALEKRQPNTTFIFDKVNSFGIASEAVYGMDVVEVYEATKRAIKHIEENKEPYCIEAATYRFRAHGGAGDDSASGYRSMEEFDNWKKRCPIEKLLATFEKLCPIDIQQMELDIKNEIEEAMTFAKTSPIPSEKGLYNGLG